MSLASQAAGRRQSVFDQLEKSAAATLGKSYWLSQIVASWSVGAGVLPDKLGLSDQAFEQLGKSFYPAFCISTNAYSGLEIDFGRMLERDDLVALLTRFGNHKVPETGVVTELVVAACLGSDHLWRDLGLWSRNDLSSLLNYYYPELASRNTKDMKWKKFIYKQLCDEEGVYLCRAPSCEVCDDKGKCFGPEEE